MIISISLPSWSVLPKSNHLFKYYSNDRMNFVNNNILEAGTPVIKCFPNLTFIETEGTRKYLSVVWSMWFVHYTGNQFALTLNKMYGGSPPVFPVLSVRWPFSLSELLCCSSFSFSGPRLRAPGLGEAGPANSWAGDRDLVTGPTLRNSQQWATMRSIRNWQFKQTTCAVCSIVHLLHVIKAPITFFCI